MTAVSRPSTGWILRLSGIAAAVILPYLPVWGRLGIYWDDVLFLGIAELRGRDQLLYSLSIDRPLLGLSFAALWQLIGMQLWLYQLVMIGLRWVLALLTAALADELQPQQPALGTAAGLLVAAYPGFLQYATAYLYASTMIALVLYGLSLLATLWALRAATPRAALLWHLLSVLTVLPAVGLLEYLIGFEAVRLLLVVLLLRPHSRGDWLRLSAAVALPWAVAALVIGWRLFFFESTRDVTNIDQSVLRPLLNNPLRWLRDFAQRFILSPLNALAAWLIVPWVLIGSGFWQDLAAWAAPLTLLLAALPLLLRRQLRTVESSGGVRLLPAAAVLAGGLFVINLPIALAGRELVLFDRFDRYALPLLPLLAVLTALLLQRMPRGPGQTLMLTFLLMGGLSQAMVLRHYALDWQRQQELWQQLTLRKPTLDRGAVILLDRQIASVDLMTMSPYVIWGLANQVYPGEPVLWEIAGYPIRARNLPTMLAGRIGPMSTRRQDVQGDPARTLVIAQPLRGCVRVLTPAVWRLPPELSDEGRSVVEARFSTAWPQPDGPAVQLVAELPAWLGSADAASWCGILQQAELAEELGDEAALARLTEMVLAEGVQPDEPYEWRVFIEYLLRAGRTAEAGQLLQAMLAASAESTPVCTWWRTVSGVDCPSTQRGSIHGTLPASSADLARWSLPCLPHRCPHFVSMAW